MSTAFTRKPRAIFTRYISEYSESGHPATTRRIIAYWADGGDGCAIIPADRDPDTLAAHARAAQRLALVARMDRTAVAPTLEGYVFMVEPLAP